MKKNNKVNKTNKRKKITMIAIAAIIVVLLFLLVLASYFRDYGKVRLSTNKKDIFTISDLTVNKLKYGDNEKTVEKVLGKPNKTKEKTESIYKYKVLSYDGLTLTLKEFYDDYALVKAEITSSKYTTSRNIKVNKKITKVFRKYKVESNRGLYMYGNYSNKVLTDEENTSNIYFGLRSSKNVLFVNRDSVVDGLVTNIAKLDIEYKHGKIKKITWSYDYE